MQTWAENKPTHTPAYQSETLQFGRDGPSRHQQQQHERRRSASSHTPAFANTATANPGNLFRRVIAFDSSESAATSPRPSIQPDGTHTPRTAHPHAPPTNDHGADRKPPRRCRPDHCANTKPSSRTATRNSTDGTDRVGPSTQPERSKTTRRPLITIPLPRTTQGTAKLYNRTHQKRTPRIRGCES